MIYPHNDEFFMVPYHDEIVDGGFCHILEAMALGRFFLPDHEKEIAHAANEVEDRFKERFFEACARGIPICESPIEKILLPWLLAQRYQFFDYWPTVLVAGEGEKFSPGTLAVIPQLPIGRYRADFALAASNGGPTRFVIVECDGRKFHTGDQNLIRDGKRDAAILNNRRVLSVFRAPGTDIFRDPQAVASQVAAAVMLAWRKDNRKNDHKFSREES